jgi:hypothetical protein
VNSGRLGAQSVALYHIADTAHNLNKDGSAGIRWSVPVRQLVGNATQQQSAPACVTAIRGVCGGGEGKGNGPMDVFSANMNIMLPHSETTRYHRNKREHLRDGVHYSHISSGLEHMGLRDHAEGQDTVNANNLGSDPRVAEKPAPWSTAMFQETTELLRCWCAALVIQRVARVHQASVSARLGIVRAQFDFAKALQKARNKELKAAESALVDTAFGLHDQPVSVTLLRESV